MALLPLRKRQMESRSDIHHGRTVPTLSLVIPACWPPLGVILFPSFHSIKWWCISVCASASLTLLRKHSSCQQDIISCSGDFSDSVRYHLATITLSPSGLTWNSEQLAPMGEHCHYHLTKASTSATVSLAFRSSFAASLSQNHRITE